MRVAEAASKRDWNPCCRLFLADSTKRLNQRWQVVVNQDVLDHQKVCDMSASTVRSSFAVLPSVYPEIFAIASKM